MVRQPQATSEGFCKDFCEFRMQLQPGGVYLIYRGIYTVRHVNGRTRGYVGHVLVPDPPPGGNQQHYPYDGNQANVGKLPSEVWVYCPCPHCMGIGVVSENEDQPCPVCNTTNRESELGLGVLKQGVELLQQVIKQVGGERLVAWFITAPDRDLEHNVDQLVFAHDERTAWVLGHTHADPPLEEDEELVAKRQPESDHLLREGVIVPYVEHRRLTLRQAGFRLDGESACDDCGLSALGYPCYEVCEECSLCPSCRNQPCEQCGEASDD